MTRLCLIVGLCLALVVPGQAQVKKPQGNSSVKTEDGGSSSFFNKKKFNAIFNSWLLRDEFTTSVAGVP